MQNKRFNIIIYCLPSLYQVTKAICPLWDGQHNDGLTSLDNDDATTTWKWDDDDGAMMPKTITTQDDNPMPFLSHSPHAKQDQDKNTPPPPHLP